MKKLLLGGVMGLALAGLFAPLVHAGAFTVTFAQAGSNVVATASGSIDLSGLTMAQSSADCAAVGAEFGSFVVGGSSPCDYTTPGPAVNECPSGEELQTFDAGIATLGTTTGPATSSVCANGTPVDVYTGLISGPQTFGPGAMGTCVNAYLTIPGSPLIGLQSFCSEESSSSNGGIFGFYAAFDQSPPILEVPAGYQSGNPLSGSSTWDNTTIASLGLTPGTYTWSWGTVTDPSISVDVQAPTVPEPSSLALLGAGLLGLGLVFLRRRKVA